MKNGMNLVNHHLWIASGSAPNRIGKPTASKLNAPLSGIGR